MMQAINTTESIEVAQWETWQECLDAFQDWLQEDHGLLVRSWWSYLRSVFFREVSLLLPSSGICLDVGCGSGGYLSDIVKKRKFEGIGIDPLKSSLKECLDNAKRQGYADRLNLILGVGEYLPLKADCIQFCYIAGSLDHVKDLNQTISEFYRTLSPIGNLIILETVLFKKKRGFYDETHVYQFTLETLKVSLRKFTIVKFFRKVPIFSQIGLPDSVLQYSLLHKFFSHAPGLLGSYFNYSEVIFRCKKSTVNTVGTPTHT